MSSIPPFHFAFCVHDLQQAEQFYTQILGCSVGRSSERWVDFNFYQHQIVAHLVASTQTPPAVNPVDADQVPVPHFGVILTMAQWQKLAQRLQAAEIQFVIPPKIRFKGLAGEQATMFFHDPSGNAIEIKAFAQPKMIFATDPE